MLSPASKGLVNKRAECPVRFVSSRADHAPRPVERIADWFECGAPEAGASIGQSRLPSLIAESAARFVTIQLDAIDAAVVECLHQAAEDLELDRAILWIKQADCGVASASHYWIKAASQPGSEPLEMSVPLIAHQLQSGESKCFAQIDELHTAVDRDACLRCGVCSAVIVSVAVAGHSAGEGGVLEFGSSTEREWAPVIVEQLRVIAAVIGQALARKVNAQDRQSARNALDQLRATTAQGDVQHHPSIGPHSEDLYRPDVPERLVKEPMIGRSRALRQVIDQIHQVAVTDSTVLLLGETGTGKELLATHLHEMSVRRGRPMVRVNCSAIPATLIESELFGREKGAFTGSLARQIGRFELADRSTIFLDEIGDLPADVQVKLLRVLEERQIERLGSPHGIRIDVRIVAATHRKLEERILDGAFREDLFYRLNVFPIRVPALRDRAEDIPSLVWLFVDEFSRSFGKRIEAIPRKDMDALQRYSWPGNIRELRNVVERAMILATGTRLTIALPRRSDAAGPAARRSLKMVDVEKEHVRGVLESTGWRIRGVGGAAELLGLQPTTLETRMLKLGLSRPRLSR
jgi:formate hydrogenlyase transcriptional activator